MTQAEPGIRLIVQADDYGATPAVIEGVLRCFEAGVVTQTSVIRPSPHADQALRSALAAGLPMGAHLTLMSEWPGARWSSLTDAPSLRTADGGLPEDLRQLTAQADPDEVRTELRAQVESITRAGVSLTHIESHVQVYDAVLLAELSAETNLPCRDEIPPPGIPMPVDSLWHLSSQEPEDKLAALLAHVATLGSGLHLVVAHPADDLPDLLELCPRSSRRWKWARDIRVSDSAALLDPRFLEMCASRSIELVSLASAETQSLRSIQVSRRVSPVTSREP